MDTKILKAEVRKIEGRKVKNLRAQGILPANIYGRNIKSQAVQVLLKDFEKVYSEVGETGLVDLEVGKEVRPVLVHNVQLNPVTDKPVHVDFLQVDLKEKVEADVPVEMAGESPAEKQALGTVVQYINEIQVEALPRDLPEKFVVDISGLTEVDQAIFVRNIKVDRSKVELKGDAEAIVVKVEPPQKIEETPAPVESEAPVEGATPAKGEVPAEDQSQEKGNPSDQKPSGAVAKE